MSERAEIRVSFHVKVLKVVRGHCGVTQAFQILSIFEEKKKQLERNRKSKVLIEVWFIFLYLTAFSVR